MSRPQLAEPINMEKLGLRPRERHLLRVAMWAWTQVDNGHYLCSAGEIRSAERLVERGFLTKAADVRLFPPSEDWLIVVLTEENCAAMRQAEKAAVL